MRLIFIFGIVLCSSLSFGQGGGLILYEVASPGVGNAYAGLSPVANDASAAYTNPASITAVEGSSWLVGTQAVFSTIDFESVNGTSAQAGGLTPGFGLYYINHLNDRLSWGFSFNLPMGSSLDYGTEWEGRYYIESALLGVTNFAPTLAYKVSDKLSIGLAVNLYLGILTEDFAMQSLSISNPGDGSASLSGTSFNAGFQAGLFYEFSEFTSLGFMYRYNANIDFSGDADVSAYFGRDDIEITDLPFSTEFIIPHGLNLGFAHTINSTQLLIDIGYTTWSQFVAQPIVLNDDLDASMDRNWKDTYRIGLGLNNQFNDLWTGRLGFSYDSNPIEQNGMRPDLPVGAGYRYAVGGAYTNKKLNVWSLDVCYTKGKGEDIDLDNPLQGSLQGDYSNLGIFTLALSYGF